VRRARGELVPGRMLATGRVSLKWDTYTYFHWNFGYYSRRKAEVQLVQLRRNVTSSRHHVTISPVTYAPPVINITHHYSVALSRGRHLYRLDMNDSGLGFSGDAALTRELSSNSLNDFMAPVFGTNGPRANAKDVDLNEVFSGAYAPSSL